MTLGVSIFGQGVKSKSSAITAQGRVNVYYEMGDDRAPFAAYGTPGAILFAGSAGLPARGVYYMQTKDILFAVRDTTVYAIDRLGVITIAGELLAANDNIGYVSMTDNGTQLMIVTEKSSYIVVVTGTTSLTYAITNIVGQMPTNGAGSCAFIDGYFVINARNTQQFYISGIYDGLTWNALDFASAESQPDNIKAVYVNNGFLYLLGVLTSEVWVNSGDPLFPFKRIQGSTINHGLVSIASLASMDNSIIGLYQDRQGQLSVGVVEGGSYSDISTPDISYFLNKYLDTSIAAGFCYSMNGRYFYQINFQTDNQSWLYDFKAGVWSRLESWGMKGSKMQYGTSFGNEFIVSDRFTGRLYRLDADTFTEDGSPMVREIVFNQLFADSQNYTLISRARAWFETGQGLTDEFAQGHHPSVFLQISRDSGHTWGGYLEAGLGPIGEFNRRAEWRRLGQSRNWAFRIRMTDPIKFCLLDIAVAVGEANK